MQNNKIIVRIPKDPRTENSFFISNIPLDFVDKISETEWKECIDEINNVFFMAERPTFLNLFKLLLIIPALWKIKSYEKNITKAIDNVNAKLKKKGFKIENPVMNGYTELVISFTLQ